MNLTKLLESIPYFKSLDENMLQKLRAKSDISKLKCGEKLLRQGEGGNEVYILLEGRLRALREEDKQPAVVLGEISKGEIVGEMASLLGEKRNATIIAVRDCVLLKLKGADFISLLQKTEGSIKQLMQTVVKRTKKTFVPKHKITSVAIIPITKGIDLDRFCHQLEESLQSYTRAKLLTPSIIKEEQNKANAAQQGLTDYEDEYAMLLYQTKKKLDKWTEECVGKVDKILIIADAKQSPKIRGFEEKLSAMLANTNHAAWELVLLHPSKCQKPKNTNLWLKNRTLNRHYHIAQNESKDFQKLARFLTGNTIGVALSGGGFRAIVQAGILHALMEGGIPIDIIGGSSGGAFIGGGYACLDQPEEVPLMVERGQKFFKSSKKLTFPIVSLFSGKNFTKAMKRFYGKKRIEDLWTDFFCLSLSLVTGKLNIHRTGYLWKNIRASTAVMGILPPVLKGKDCLVDGGLINACPTNILVQMGAEKVIVINASTQSGIQTDEKFSPSVSGWSLLLKRLNPFHKKRITPNIGTNIIQSMYMASNHLQDKVYSESRIDLFIEPPMGNFDSMNTDSAKEMYKIGYEYGISQIETWKKQLGFNTQNTTEKS